LACLNNDWMHLTDDQLAYFIRMREDYENNFRKIIKNGVEQGEIKANNQEVMVFSILSTLRTLYLWYGKTKKISAEELQKSMSELYLNGITNK